MSDGCCGVRLAMWHFLNPASSPGILTHSSFPKEPREPRIRGWSEGWALGGFGRHCLASDYVLRHFIHKHLPAGVPPPPPPPPSPPPPPPPLPPVSSLVPLFTPFPSLPASDHSFSTELLPSPFLAKVQSRRKVSIQTKMKTFGVPHGRAFLCCSRRWRWREGLE